MILNEDFFDDNEIEVSQDEIEDIGNKEPDFILSICFDNKNGQKDNFYIENWFEYNPAISSYRIIQEKISTKIEYSLTTKLNTKRFYNDWLKFINFFKQDSQFTIILTSVKKNKKIAIIPNDSINGLEFYVPSLMFIHNLGKSVKKDYIKDFKTFYNNLTRYDRLISEMKYANDATREHNENFYVYNIIPFVQGRGKNPDGAEMYQAKENNTFMIVKKEKVHPNDRLLINQIDEYIASGKRMVDIETNVGNETHKLFFHYLIDELFYFDYGDDMRTPCLVRIETVEKI